MRMNKIAIAMLGGACAVAAAAPAAAQQSTGGANWVADIAAANRADQIQGTTEEMRVRRTMDQRESYSAAYVHASMVSNCIVGRAGADAGSLLGGPTTDDEEFKRLETGLAEEYRACMKDDAVGIPMEIFNYTLAEQSVLTEAPTLEPRAMSLNQDEADAYVGLAPGVKADMAMIGRCAAVYSPGLSYEVLKTVPGSDSETSALGALYRATPECGLRDVPEKVPTGFQRGVLAAGLYHWMHRG